MVAFFGRLRQVDVCLLASAGERRPRLAGHLEGARRFRLTPACFSPQTPHRARGRSGVSERSRASEASPATHAGRS